MGTGATELTGAMHALQDTYIIFMSLLSLLILYPAGNLKAVDAFFFGASASTESGLNTYVSDSEILPLRPQEGCWNTKLTSI